LEVSTYCFCTPALSSGSLLSIGFLPRLTWTPSKPRLLANATASSLPVCWRFQSVTPILTPGAFFAIGAVATRPPVEIRNDRREPFMIPPSNYSTEIEKSSNETVCRTHNPGRLDVQDPPRGEPPARKEVASQEQQRVKNIAEWKAGRPH